MAIDFHLTDRRAAASNDPRGRSWYGWDRYVTDEELWEVNRGDWVLASAPLSERFATLSYQGEVKVIAEITGRKPCGDKWALLGDVLKPGDPVYDAMIGATIPPSRNPVRYWPTRDVDNMTTSERAISRSQEPATMLLTWNPAKWSWSDRHVEIAALNRGGAVRARWATGSRKGGIEPGDRVFLLEQGPGPRGIVASGQCTTPIYLDQHWNDDRPDDDANYVDVKWDVLLSDEDRLPFEVLVNRIASSNAWVPQGSGTVLPPNTAAELEDLWAEHNGLPIVEPKIRAGGQRWQMDAAKRKKVEDAAQARLERHYCELGWVVKDQRYGNPYDAIATKAGRKPLFLEAKGTETAGASVIVTRNEVAFAREHPGQCRIGILANVKFSADGDVDPESGTFTVQDWNPSMGNLSPREYDWAPPAAPVPPGGRPVAE